jgi:glycosyltransferase involved in cell wall biosynthesis
LTESISVIIPVYNCADFLAEAIQSVLAQSYPASEIIVVDDGSTDGSVSVAAGFPQARVLSQSNAGPGSARNMGVLNASGSYLAFLDADDLWAPDKLQCQMSAMEAGDPDMVFGRVEVFRDSGPALEIYEGVIVGAMLVKRDSFDRVGGFPEATRIGEFIDWYARAQECGLRSVCLPDIVMRRRLHTHNLTKEQDTRTAYFDVLREALRRRQGKTAEAG